MSQLLQLACPTAPNPARPPSKNRVGGSPRSSALRAPKNRSQLPESHRVSRPDATITASGRPVWPNRDPIGELGGMNLSGMVGNNLIRHYDMFGLLFEGLPPAPFPPLPKPLPDPRGEDCRTGLPYCGPGGYDKSRWPKLCFSLRDYDKCMEYPLKLVDSCFESAEQHWEECRGLIEPIYNYCKSKCLMLPTRRDQIHCEAACAFLENRFNPCSLVYFAQATYCQTIKGAAATVCAAKALYEVPNGCECNRP
jgi:hypothetical protein